MMELKGPLKKGDKVPVTLAFEKAGEVDVQAVGATAPTSGQMDHAMPGMQKPMKMNSDHKM
jgi:periplasmic copper chaperone A